MSKRRGLTLPEVLVVILLTTLVLAMVGGTLIFLAESSGTLIHKGEELTLTQSIEDYLRGLVKKDKDDKSIIGLDTISDEIGNGNENKPVYLSDGNLFFQNPVSGEPAILAFEDTGLESFDIVREPAEGNEYFVKCYMKYKNGSEYSFILGVVNTN